MGPATNNERERTMSDFTTTFVVEQTPEEAFQAITNPRGWWSENIKGTTDKLGEEWTYSYKDAHRCLLKLTESVPGKKVVYHILENYFDFTEDKTEWIGTDLIFDISDKDGKTEVNFKHQGLVPEYECYDLCSSSWGSYVNGSLRALIRTGEGRPNPME